LDGARRAATSKAQETGEVDMVHKFFGVVALLLAFSPTVAAQEWPAKQPIKIIVPFTAGSATDVAGRIVYEQVGRQLGQSFIFENRGGAGTSIGAGMVAKADPDGYTILVNSTSQVVIASTQKLSFSIPDDFVGISGLADIPFVVVTTPTYKTMKEVIEAGKTKPGGIFYGTNGPGSSGHLFMEALRLAAGYPITHIPFRGTVEALTEVIAGRIDMFPGPALNAISLTKDGKLTSHAVSSPRRLALMPDVPTLAEIGLPKAQYQFWVGSFAPAKTPRPIVERLNKEVVAALKVKEVADKIAALGGAPMPMSLAEFDAFFRKEIALNAEIVKAAGIQPQ
jgi:tripartite-type tricarboxylate transporter receptor subunit TctC